MLSRLKLCSVIRGLKSRNGLNVNDFRVFFHDTLPTVTASPRFDAPNGVVLESPELPGWVKYSETGSAGTGSSEDDFVVPSLSYWVENQKIDENNSEIRSSAGDADEINASKVTKIIDTLYESPDAVVQALNGCGVPVTETLIAKMLKRSRNWISAYGFFKWAESQLGSKCSPHSYDLLVDTLGKTKKFDLMWEVVREMGCIGEGYVTLNTITMVMRRLAKDGRYKEALEAFRRIENMGLKRDIAALNVLVGALVKEGSVEHAYETYLEFENIIPPDLSTYNLLIQGWLKARKYEEAQNTMEKMLRCGFRPDTITYTSFIERYCREKDFRRVDALLKEMWEKGCPPSVVTYTIVMHSLGKTKQLDKALGVYENMKEHGCAPDSHLYNALIYILDKSGRLKDAIEIFEDMPRQGVDRDVRTYNTMITAACNHSQEERALKLLQEMEQSHVKPDIETYSPLLKMCCRLKRMKVLSFLLRHMLKNDINVDLYTYNLLIRGLCKSGKLQYACLYFEEAVLKGFVPWETVHTMLIAELERKGMSKAKVRINELMLQANRR